MNRLYVRTDIDITVSVSGFQVSDIESMQIQLISNSATVTLSTADEDITINEDGINLSIGRDKINQPGSYEVRMFFEDTNGKVRGLKSNPGYLLFV